MRCCRCLIALLAAFVIVATAGAACVAASMLLLDAALVGSTVIAVGERGAIVRSTDNGKSWQAADSGVQSALTGVSFAANTPCGWAVGHDALILASDDAGITWHKSWKGGNVESSFLDVCALDARHIIAVGAYGLYLESTDGGQSWAHRKILADDMHFNRLSRGAEGTLYLAGERGTLLRSTDKGTTWLRLSSPYEGSFYGILPLAAHTLIAHGLRGRLYRSFDDGATWTLVPVPQPALLATACVLKSGDIIFAGQSRALFISHDGGRIVTTWPASLATAVAELIEAPDGSVLALGEAGATILPKP